MGLAVTVALAVAAVATAPLMPRVVGAFAPYDDEPVRGPVPSVAAFGAVTAVAVAAVTVALRDRPGWLPAYLYLTVAGIVLAAVDRRVHRLPDAVVLPSYPVLAALLGVAAVVDGATRGSWDAGRALGAVVAAGVLLAVFGVMYLVPRGGLGLGDVKLAGLLGAALGWLGPSTVLLGLFTGLVVAGLYAGVLLVTRRATRSDPIAYGPHLLLGAFVAIVVTAAGS